MQINGWRSSISKTSKFFLRPFTTKTKLLLQHTSFVVNITPVITVCLQLNAILKQQCSVDSVQQTLFAFKYRSSELWTHTSP